jgi:hypothetical protein
MESAFMARKDERSTRLRQAYGAQARNIQRRTQNSAKECLRFVTDALDQLSFAQCK